MHSETDSVIFLKRVLTRCSVADGLWFLGEVRCHCPNYIVIDHETALEGRLVELEFPWRVNEKIVRNPSTSRVWKENSELSLSVV